MKLTKGQHKAILAQAYQDKLGLALRGGSVHVFGNSLRVVSWKTLCLLYGAEQVLKDVTTERRQQS